MEHQPDPRFLPSDAELIRYKVRRLLGRYGFRASDEDDLRQELAIHVFQRSKQYDPTRGTRSTFVDRVVSNKIATIIEGRKARKRDYRRCTATDPEKLEALGAAGVDEGARDRALDLTEAVATLPPDLRDLAIRLKAKPPADVQRDLGMTRGQLRHRMKLIGEHLSKILLDSPDTNNQPDRGSGR